MDELKPCPFCSGEAGMHTDGFWWWVECGECEATTHGRDEELDAIEEWNRRVNNG